MTSSHLLNCTICYLTWSYSVEYIRVYPCSIISARKLTAMRKVIQTCCTSFPNVYLYLIFLGSHLLCNMCLIGKALWEGEGDTSKSRKLGLVEKCWDDKSESSLLHFSKFHTFFWIRSDYILYISLHSCASVYSWKLHSMASHRSGLGFRG